MAGTFPSPDVGDHLIDHISKMPDDVLVRILSRLSVKDAVVTDSLSKRWRHLWRNLIRLNFDGTETLNEMANDEMICDLESAKFTKQVNNVISSHNHPMIQLFRIHFNLDCRYSECINEWIKFAIDKKVERMELNLLDISNYARNPAKNYNFMLPSLNAVSLTLKMLVLCSVNLDEPTLNVILKNSPHLMTLTMLNSGLFPHIRVGGRDINLKKVRIVACFGIESISLYDFDLKSFLYHGEEIELHLTDLPKLKKVDIGQVSVGSENNVFRQISSCAPYLEVLILEVWFPQVSNYFLFCL
ncbi:F-box/FBD/LRR-repeat protein At5g56420-like [Bidens hawaiensis]|uniref:F-box/FBD/LRR-repeat protein At5g56420-like n=1 Tax=Bidens hawaiensis TaxID=980011 RepID=UPI00404B7164